jgi:hypothetical protein
MKVRERRELRCSRAERRTFCTPIQEGGAVLEEVLRDVCDFLEGVRHPVSCVRLFGSGLKGEWISGRRFFGILSTDVEIWS